MRPPSYYSSLVASNSQTSYLGANSSSQNTSYQLRSSFSSPTSASYASRTHLPYVAQSSLVAHCFTTGSSTRPYGAQGRSSYGSAHSPSYGGSASSSLGSYRRPTSARPPSTRRPVASSLEPGAATGAGSSGYLSGSSSALSRPSYLSTHSSGSRSSYRPNASSYYKPIRLRERPILTQLARLGASSPVGAPAAAKQPTHSEDTQTTASWSSDVARNISRNKYLIKFRELGPKQPPVEPAADGSQLEAARRVSDSRPACDTEPDEAAKLEPPATAESRAPNEGQPEQAELGQAGLDSSSGRAQPAEPSPTIPPDATIKKAPAKRRNVKLKLQTTKPKQQSAPSAEPEPQTTRPKPDLPATETPQTRPRGRKKKEEVPTVESADVVLSAKALASNARDAHQANVGGEDPVPAIAPGGRPVQKRIRFREYQYQDFNFLTVLGHGGWGFVVLAELKEHDACFAVKCIKKLTIVEDDDFESIMIERKVLTLGNEHPFICKLFCTFETPGYLFFVMEFCPGGDLMFHVQREGKFDEPRCRFYAAEIICAIRFLHNRHIIYRDLKLDNILLDAQGHIRLVDFGMCQCRTYREEMLPSNFCGTPEYISPEIIKGVPYNHSVDWWSFGVLLYEMAVGKMPFRGGDENELLWNVCYEQIHYPMFLSKELTSLLQQLLEREPSKRMGMATCKSGDIQEQPFFRPVDWRAVEKLRVRPPFVPEVTSKRDVQNFDTDFTESACELSPVDENFLASLDQTQFLKFPYTNPSIEIFDALSANLKRDSEV